MSVNYTFVKKSGKQRIPVENRYIYNTHIPGDYCIVEYSLSISKTVAILKNIFLHDFKSLQNIVFEQIIKLYYFLSS